MAKKFRVIVNFAGEVEAENQADALFKVGSNLEHLVYTPKECLRDVNVNIVGEIYEDKGQPEPGGSWDGYNNIKGPHS